jgi:adenylate cyclase
MNTSQEDVAGDLFSENLIHEQLQKIFLCPAFSVSEILRRFLTYITQETLAGRSNTIKEYTIAVQVLKKPSSFKPQHDAIVRIHAGRLRRALNYYYKEAGSEDNIEISVPKGSYIPVFEKRRPRKAEADPGFVPLNDSLDKVNLVILPFSTLETEISRRSFADSLGQQLSASLALNQDFSVVSYYTTRRLSDQNREIPKLVTGFDAQYVVSGNVLFENQKLKVFAQLTEGLTGTQIWSECYQYNFTLSGLFAASDEIISRMTAALGDFNGIIIQQVSRRLTKNRLGQVNTTTLSLYHDFYSGFNETSFKKAHISMESAVESDPFNDVAWSFLGQLSLMAGLFNQRTLEDPLALCLRYARRALNLNPSSQHGYITLAMAQIFIDNKQASLESLENARRINPRASGLMGIIGCLMISVGEYDRGLSLLEKSMEMNAYFPAIFYLFTSLCLYKQGDFAGALRELEKSSMAEETLHILLRISILIQMGRKPAVANLVKLLKNRSLNKVWISREYISKFLFDAELVEQLTLGFKTIRLPLLTVA